MSFDEALNLSLTFVVNEDTVCLLVVFIQSNNRTLYHRKRDNGNVMEVVDESELTACYKLQIDFL